jgi:hypothetical protein
MDALKDAAISHLAHGFAANVPAKHGGKPNIARDAGPKSVAGRGAQVQFNHGVSAKQVEGARIGGLSHKTGGTAESGGLASSNILEAKLLPAKQHTKPATRSGGWNCEVPTTPHMGIPGRGDCNE